MRVRYGRGWAEAISPPTLSWHGLESDSTAALAPLLTEAGAVDGLDAAGLGDALRGVGRLSVLLPDRTRPAGLDVILPAVFTHVERVAPAATVTLGVGGGSHAPDDPSRGLAWVPERWRSRVGAFSHDSRDDATMVTLGETPSGTPVTLHRHLTEVDLLVVTGGVGYHYFAGFSGGRKAIFPGFGAYESIRRNHRLILDPGGGLHPACRPGSLDGNPVHEDLVHAVSLLPTPRFLANVTLDREERAIDLAAGDLVTAHEEACRRVHAREAVVVPAAVDLVVADAGGFPRDIDLVQTHKALKHLSPVVAPGGAVVLSAECEEGVGSSTFEAWFDHPDAASLDAAMRADYTLNAHTALSVRQLTERHHVFLVSSVDPARVRRMGATPAASLQEGLDRAVAAIGGSGTARRLTSPAHHVYEVSAR